MTELWCVNCWARGRPGVLADVVLDGRSLCQPCARPMIKVIASTVVGEPVTDDATHAQEAP